jgi:hypothetical protein
MTVSLGVQTYTYNIYYARAACLLFLFAVCQRSSFEAPLSESECKGTAFFNTDQILKKVFLKKEKKGEERERKEEKRGPVGKPQGTKRGGHYRWRRWRSR